MTQTKPAVTAVLIVVGLGVGFGGGYFFRNYQLTKMRGNFTAGGANGMQRFTGARTGANGQNGTPRNFGGAVNGTILSMDDKSVTVKMQDGSSRIVLFSDTTKYSNSVSANKTDIKTGVEVSIFGTANSDGSITATTVQLNPMMFRPQGSTAPDAK